MTKRDNELTRHELLDKRLKQLFEKFDWHRGQLPQDLLTAVEGVRKAHEMKDAPHTGPVPWWNPVHEPPKGWNDQPQPPKDVPVSVVAPEPVRGLERPIVDVSEPVPAVAPDAPAKPGDLT